MFPKIGPFVSNCVDETGYRQINLKLDYPVENRAVGSATFKKCLKLILTHLGCIKCNEINIGHSDVLKYVSYKK